MENINTELLFGAIKKHWLPLALACIGLIFLIYGLIVFWQNDQKSSNPDFYDFSKDSHAASKIVLNIDVEGQVAKPGVYKLSQDSIVQDALIAAGGLSEDADRNWVSKNLNLAQKLTDAQKIYIPRQGEIVSESLSTSQNSTAVKNGLININTASEIELDSLPGVGPVTAEKIINNRPYLAVNDLLDKKVVSAKVFDEIKDKIAVN